MAMESATQDAPPTSPPAAPSPSESSPAGPPSAPPTQKLGPAWLTTWLAKLSIEQRVRDCLGLVVQGIGSIGVEAYRNSSVVVKNSRLDSASHELVQLLGSIEEALIAAESGHRRYLVTGDESYLMAHRTIVEQMPEYSRYLQALAGPIPEQRD